MRRTFTTIALAGLVAGLCCAPASLADILVLKDGTQVQGDVKRTDTGWTVTTTDGKSVDVAADDVRTIEIGGGKTTDASAVSNLASLRRSVESLTNPAAVLDRYRRFLDQNKGTAAIEDAKRDMAIWQDRLDRSLIKVGTQWVTPQQKLEMASQAAGIAQQAADLLKQGRTNQADPVIQRALDADPRNSAALYLHGLVLFGEGQVVPARKAFEAVLATLPNHAPTFNNLGVVLWRQNQQMGAMKYFEQAMVAAPIDKLILDNVAEALAALPDDQRHNPLAVRAFKEFSEQDRALQQIMAQYGWHRWGSTWVDQPELDKLNAAEQEVKDKLDKLTADITAAKQKIADDNTAIDGNNRSMQQMQVNSISRDAKGNIFQAPLPDAYYTMENDNEKLTADRAKQEAQIQADEQQGREVQQSIPVPQFTGELHMVGAEGAPFPPTTTPSTAPGSAPADSSSSLAPSTEPTTGPTPPVMMPLP